MIGTIIHVNLHPIGTDLEEKEEDKMRLIFACARSHIVYFAMSHMRVCACVCMHMPCTHIHNVYIHVWHRENVTTSWYIYTVQVAIYHGNVK